MDETGLVQSRGDDQLIDLAECRQRGVEHGLGVGQAVRPAQNGGGLAAKLAHLAGDFVEFGLGAGGEQHFAAERGERKRGGAAESARGAGDDRDFVLDVEQRQRIAQRLGNHRITARSQT